jgi:hypothetical protein
MSRLAPGAGFAVDDLRIVTQTHRWSEPDAAPGYRMVFVRRGPFRLRLPEWNGLVDPVTAYLRRPDDEQQIAHRPETEDACTVVTFSDSLAEEVIRERPPVRPLLTTGRTDLAHRVLFARARHGADEFELAERAVRLAEALSG